MAEFTDTKTRYEATKYAEAQIEQIRYALTTVSSASGVTAAVSSAIDSSQSSSLGYSFSTTFSPSTITPTSSGLVSFSLIVSTSSESITIPVRVAWNQGPLSNPDDVSLTVEGTDYEGSIPLPIGTLTAVEARQAVSLATATATELIASGSVVSIYKADFADSEVPVAGVQIGNDFVALVELSDAENEIFTISGRVYLDDDRTPVVQGGTDLAFGCTYTGSTNATGICNVDDPSKDDDVLDIAATGGAGCIFYDFGSNKSVTAPTYGEVEYQYGDYICLAGTGWNGSIAPVVLDIAQGGGGEDSAYEIDGFVCAPQLRGFRYLIIDPVVSDDYNDIDEFETAYDAALASGNWNTLFDTIENTVVGQSGLVRFYLDSDGLRSEEGVKNSSYIWLNPDMVSSARADSDQLNYAYSVYNGRLKALPGDVSYQDYYIFEAWKTTGRNGIDQDCDNYGLELYEEVSAENSYSSLGGLGRPGNDYDPDGVGVEGNYPVAMYNRNVSADASEGSLILGYTLARYDVSGRIVVKDNDVPLNINDFRVVANPEPVVTINCTISETVIEGADTQIMEYSCGVPVGWQGYVIPHLTSAALVSATTDYNRCYRLGDDLSAFYASLTLDDDEFESYDYYHDNVSTNDFSGFSLIRVDVVDESIELDDMYFYDSPRGSDSCP